MLCATLPLIPCFIGEKRQNVTGLDIADGHCLKPNYTGASFNEQPMNERV